MATLLSDIELLYISVNADGSMCTHVYATLPDGRRVEIEFTGGEVLGVQ